MRRCLQCDWKTATGDVKTDLVQYSDHSTEHNFSPAQWTEAWKVIVESRPAKSRAE